MRSISVVISSLRPDRLEETIDSTAMHGDLVEVVVVSPYPPKPRDFVRHVPVPAPGNPNELTFTQKFNLGAKNANCDYVVYSNDDFHFRPGWAPALIKHMEQNTIRPYLAVFHMAVEKKIHSRYTAFGLLYANIGCIRKADLKLIGDYLFEERLFMYTSDIDIGLRVWSAGGRVGICQEVVLDCDRDIDQVSIPLCSSFVKESGAVSLSVHTYRNVWFDHDCSVFFKIWFKRYFWLFFRNYKRLQRLFTNEDGVLPSKRYHSGLLKITLLPIIHMYINPKFFFGRPNKLKFIQNHLVRVVNRRWHKLDYELPYAPLEIIRKL